MYRGERRGEELNNFRLKKKNSRKLGKRGGRGGESAFIICESGTDHTSKPSREKGRVDLCFTDSPALGENWASTCGGGRGVHTYQKKSSQSANQAGGAYECYRLGKRAFVSMPVFCIGGRGRCASRVKERSALLGKTQNFGTWKEGLLLYQ